MDDTWLNASQGTFNYGGATSLTATYAGSKVLLAFDCSDMPTGKVLDSMGITIAYALSHTSTLAKVFFSAKPRGKGATSYMGTSSGAAVNGTVSYNEWYQHSTSSSDTLWHTAGINLTTGTTTFNRSDAGANEDAYSGASHQFGCLGAGNTQDIVFGREDTIIVNKTIYGTWDPDKWLTLIIQNLDSEGPTFEIYAEDDGVEPYAVLTVWYSEPSSGTMPPRRRRILQIGVLEENQFPVLGSWEIVR